ncbi:MAG: alpha/beta hydrolase [Christensenellaceae bacterium]|jgi:pimeloyl-ACP methyl ester carboxylesterase|nr:alpha/beta hydrolase [Christensenellaceae bacterium]
MIFENNGVKLFYKTVGTGSKTIIFLHGNGETSAIFDGIANRLMDLDFTSYLLDSRGHGQSDGVHRLTYSDMADDVLALINHEHLTKPAILGFSDGAIVALLATIKSQSLIGKILLCGINLNPRGIKFRMRLLMRLSFLLYHSDLLRLMLEQPNILTKDIQNITIPVIIFYAEYDMVKLSHSKIIESSVKGAQFVLVIGEKHQTYVLDNDKLFKYIAPYIGPDPI